MISWRIASALRNRGHVVVAIKRDRPELESRRDATVLASAAAEKRAVVTNNIRDYHVAHERMRTQGQEHFGVIYTHDDTLPRNRSAFSLWVSSLEEFLQSHPGETALLNRVRHLLP